MQKNIKVLAVILGAQVALAAALGLGSPQLSARAAGAPWLQLDAQSLSRITLTDAEGEQVVLAREGEGWSLPGADGFPADEAKVKALLERLDGLERRMPVATSGSARERFKVAEDAFERRIELSSGDTTLATLYLGSSPAFRQVHGRLGKDDAIYVLDFAAHEAPAQAADWEDKGVLRFAREDLRAIRIGELELRREAEGDQPAWTAGSGSVDQQAVDRLAQRLADLRVGAVLGKDARPEYGLDQPKLILEVRRGEEAVEYRLAELEDGEGYVLKASSRPEYFRLPAYTGKELVEAAAVKVTEPAEAAEAAADEPDAQSS